MSREYEIKTKKSKNDVFIRLSLENFYLEGRFTFGGEARRIWFGRILLREWGMSEFLAGGPPSPTPAGKTLVTGKGIKKLIKAVNQL